MADVRSMLRAERESRRITHPHASYTSTGNLICNICDVPVKSERAWNSHLHSTQHNLRLGREKDVAQARGQDAGTTNKKRKAVEFEEPSDIERKKVKPADSTIQDQLSNDEPGPETVASEDLVDIAPAVLGSASEEDVAAAELLAFERDLAALEEEAQATVKSNLAAITASATISAPALSAQELAAQAREEQSKQKTRRDEEIEDEREDAARALEDAFEEMDALQERLRKLQERREALRVPATDVVDDRPNLLGELENGIPDRTVTQALLDDDESEEDDEDEWAFGAR